MFVTNVFNFASEGKTFRYSSINAPLAVWGPWHTAEHRTEGTLKDVETSMRDMITPENIMDIFRFFTLYATDKEYRKYKIICRYQQFEGANMIVDRVVAGKPKQGLIWHFQGSGKSLLMVFAAQKLRMTKGLENPTVIIVDDRIDLETQMTATFNASDIEGLLLTTESGAIKLAHFLDEQRMCRLYEKFILEFYRKEMPFIKANASKIEWQLDDGLSALLPSMQSDIMLTKGDKTLIIDAKYYSHSTQVQYGKHTLHSQNVYQIFTYVMNKDVGNTGNVAGMLLYAKTDEEITPDTENTIMGHKISAKTLDLNCSFESISAQLKTIAQNYFGLSS